jgi:imidazolonepropionase-like amidohydrolase
VNRILLEGATLIDGTGRAPIDDSVVLVAGERIANVGRRADTPVPDDCERVDLTGKTIIPGLIDGHAHVAAVAGNLDFKAEDPEAVRELFLREFIEHGVTSVRDTGGPDAGPIFHLLRAGRSRWPRIFGSGPNLDGPPGGPWPGLLVVQDSQHAREMVRGLIAAGVSFLKTYIWMSTDVLTAVVEEAHASGVRVAAHVGHAITAKEAILCGVDALEHVQIGRELVSADQLPLLRTLPARTHDAIFDSRSWRFIDPASPPADRLIELMVQRGVFLTPTLTVARTVHHGDDPRVVAPEGIQRMPQEFREQWELDAYTIDHTAEDFAHAKVQMAKQMEFVGRAHEAGVSIVAGTDTPNPFVLPGVSLHDEMGLLVDCGLSPMEALVSATGRAAQLLGEQNHLGTVEKGKLADVVVLDADPLKDIANTRRVRAVLKSGQTLAGSLTD